MKHFNLKLFLLLFLAGLVGAAAVLPYVFTTTGITAGAQLPVSLPAIVAFQLVQAAILLAVAVAIGTLAYQDAGLGLPYLEPLAAGKKLPSGAGHMIVTSLVTGVATVIVIQLLDVLLFGTALGQSVSDSLAAPLWQRILATLYAGIDEELLMRFFLLSVLAWIFGRASGKPDRTPSVAGWWASIVLTALIFGIGHLPVAFTVVTLTGSVVTRALLLNGIAAVVFGWLYWKRGLESAMVAHFAAAVVLLVILPLTVGIGAQ